MASIGTEPQRCGEKRVDIDIMEDQRRYTELIGAWNETWASKIGQPRRVCVQTFGCQQNEADSERLRGHGPMPWDTQMRRRLRTLT